MEVSPRSCHSPSCYSRHIIPLVPTRSQPTDLVVCLGVVIDVAVAVNKDDVSGQGFRAIVRDVEVMCSTSRDLGGAERCGGKHEKVPCMSLELPDKVDGRQRRRRSLDELGSRDEERER